VDGPVRNTLIEFVSTSSEPGSSGFIPASERVAAFDNDGTLWAEQPIPVQAPFLLAKLADQVRADSTLADVEPYRSIVSCDPDFFAGLARQEPDAVTLFLSGVGRAWEGSSPEEYEAEVRAFVSSYRDQ